MTHAETLSRPLSLPCGAILPNRLAKVAMTEGLADGTNTANARTANARFETLYRRWGAGGAGLLITGNVQIDRWHLERASNIAIEGRQGKAATDALARMASAAKAHGSKVIMQLSHAGRQTQKMINPTPMAPSSVPLAIKGRFGIPIPMSEAQIDAAIAGFVNAAQVARDTGFDGVQIHAAHGYLISQFLSPLSNRRRDGWGGDLPGRARFLLDVVKQVRATCPAPFILSVKLNSADFQTGGFSEEDSARVAAWLAAAGCDLLEVSGGNYEQPRMFDFERKDPLASTRRASTTAREAYFLKFVPKLRAASADLPIMVTGGFRSAEAMASALRRDGVDVIGLARPLILDPNAARALLDGTRDRLDSLDAPQPLGPGLFGPASPISALRDLNGWATVGWQFEQIYALADGRDPNLSLYALRALLAYDKTEKRAARALVRDPIKE